ncbi:MAG: hypothetical protein ACRD7E_21615, partial [Bryobacteraceae bacterium]
MEVRERRYSEAADHWDIYQAVEEEWLRQRCKLVIRQAPAVAEAALLDLELAVGQLQLRAMEFRYALGMRRPRLRIGMWEMIGVQITDSERWRLRSVSGMFRQLERNVEDALAALVRSPDYVELRRRQAHTWKTPEGQSLYRSYWSSLERLRK